jgi:hypothetical protein
MLDGAPEEIRTPDPQIRSLKAKGVMTRHRAHDRRSSSFLEDACDDYQGAVRTESVAIGRRQCRQLVF